MRVLVMSKSLRKASYDLTFKLKAVKCAEEKTKEEAACEFNVDPRRVTAKLSWRLPGSFSTETFSPIPDVHMFVYVVASKSTIARLLSTKL